MVEPVRRIVDQLSATIFAIVLRRRKVLAIEDRLTIRPTRFIESFFEGMACGVRAVHPLIAEQQDTVRYANQFRTFFQVLNNDVIVIFLTNDTSLSCLTSTVFPVTYAALKRIFGEFPAKVVITPPRDHVVAVNKHRLADVSVKRRLGASTNDGDRSRAVRLS